MAKGAISQVHCTCPALTLRSGLAFSGLGLALGFGFGLGKRDLHSGCFFGEKTH